MSKTKNPLSCGEINESASAVVSTTPPGTSDFEIQHFLYFLIRQGYPIEIARGGFKIGHFHYSAETRILNMESVQLPEEGHLRRVYDFLAADDTLIFFDEGVEDVDN